MSKQTTKQEFKPGMKYYAHHNPTGEDWVILGINRNTNEVCAAGWPPTIAKLSDCSGWEEAGPLTEEELKYRTKQFRRNWL